MSVVNLKFASLMPIFISLYLKEFIKFINMKIVEKITK